MNEPKWYEKILDDKVLVIFCTTILGLVAMFKFSAIDSTVVVSSVISGLFGIAVGKALSK